MPGKKFSCIWGVDQTGAALQGGLKAKPLSCAVLFENPKATGGKNWHLALLKLKSASPAEFQKQSKELDLPAQQERDWAIVLDCVLGLPESVCRSEGIGNNFIWSLFKKARDHSFDGKSYGRKIAESFFENILKASGEIGTPARQCELIAGANSVFRSRPFQKNIQTGTYRLWKDLSQSGVRWANLWPASLWGESDPDLPWIFEGYPSLVWKKILGLPTRDPKSLRRLFESRRIKALNDIAVSEGSWKALLQDADLADAFVLAVGAYLLQKQAGLLMPESFRELLPGARRKIQLEGWILGLPQGIENG